MSRSIICCGSWSNIVEGLPLPSRHESSPLHLLAAKKSGTPWRATARPVWRGGWNLCEKWRSMSMRNHHIILHVIAMVPYIYIYICVYIPDVMHAVDACEHVPWCCAWHPTVLMSAYGRLIPVSPGKKKQRRLMIPERPAVTPEGKHLTRGATWVYWTIAKVYKTNITV